MASESSMPQVTPADQGLLNQFSTQIRHRDRLAAVLSQLEFEKEQVDDLSLELEMIDDEKVSWIPSGTSALNGISTITNTLNASRVDNTEGAIAHECFVKLSVEETLERLEQRGELLDREIDETKTKVESLDTTLKELKTTLYAKFGDGINLER
ncbi:tubulin-binding prefolding complex subunit [Martiniozyma asiatica (nom. inval.)]|nr:tubulin-binding prefolding complex subunit [Martiniozyma asiatica]